MADKVESKAITTPLGNFPGQDLTEARPQTAGQKAAQKYVNQTFDQFLAQVRKNGQSHREKWDQDIGKLMPTQSRYSIGQLFERKEVKEYLDHALKNFYPREFARLNALVRRRRKYSMEKDLTLDHFLAFAWNELDMLIHERLSWTVLCDMADVKPCPLLPNIKNEAKLVQLWKVEHLSSSVQGQCWMCKKRISDYESYWCDVYEIGICELGPCVQQFEAYLIRTKAPVLWTHNE